MDQQAEASRLRLELSVVSGDLAALRKQQKRHALVIKLAVRAAHGEYLLELNKLRSVLHDAKAAVSRSKHEVSIRMQLRATMADRQAELVRLRFQLSEKESQLAAQSIRLQQLEVRAEHSRQQSASMAAATAAAKQDKQEAEAASAVAEAASAAAEAELSDCERALGAEKKDHLASLSQVQRQLGDAEMQVSKVQAQLEDRVEQQLRVVDLPPSRNWAVSVASKAVYRSLEVQALVELLESRLWRPEDIATALSLACFEDTAEPTLLQVFDQKEVWYLRTRGWMRAVHLELETGGN